MEDIVQFAKEKSFSKFSDAVKKELKQKLANHPEIVKHSNEFERITKMKDLFKQISTEFKVPAEVVPEPVVPNIEPEPAVVPEPSTEV